ncbi:hypothetical protein CAEBREN_19620 [Caenorhabditis brenneri]|uniref:Uncharacterized protein n=1 Tax=Caenorhabditis brenneri TaxID=135651 RepID=G0MA28_CAEBE|nr:hypothetical protein CAEBREN_19620 [Caenorhabditis brenneri]
MLSVDIVSKINLHFNGTPFKYQFVISQAKDSHHEQTHNVRVGDAVVPSIHKDTETVTYWDDKITGIEHIVSYIKDLFDVPITEIYLKSEEYENEFIDTMDCIMKMQESVQACTLHAEKSTDEVGDAVVPSIHKDTETVTYWDDKITGIEHIVSYIKDLFDVPITEIYLKSEEYENEFIDTMDCIMKMQESVQACTLHAEKSTDETGGSQNLTVGGIDIRRNDGTVGTILFGWNNVFEFGVDLLLY